MSETETLARRATDSPAVDRLARVGLVCRAVLYALIGVLAIQIAFGGNGGREADKNGAISEVASLPFGSVILWIMVVGFAALIVWQVGEAIKARGLKDRAEPIARVAVYAFICAALLTMLLTGETSNDDERSRDITGKLLDLPGGQILVGAIGLGIIALGVYWMHYGLKKKFREHLKPMPAKASAMMDRLGLAGYLARGLIAAGAGVFVIQAAVTFDPDKAGGIDATLRAFAETPAGPWLLVVVALGLLLFGVYCLGEARWRRT